MYLLQYIQYVIIMYLHSRNLYHITSSKILVPGRILPVYTVYHWWDPLRPTHSSSSINKNYDYIDPAALEAIAI